MQKFRVVGEGYIHRELVAKFMPCDFTTIFPCLFWGVNQFIVPSFVTK